MRSRPGQSDVDRRGDGGSAFLSAIHSILPAVFLMLSAIHGTLSAVFLMLSAIHGILSAVFLMLSAIHGILSAIGILEHPATPLSHRFA